ncbi:MAG: hypothetical protein K5798_03545 [Nitrosopumilus sp.]|uniref:hypothetical protein n=1 Tax=Nitrosopumilus sp. TaxID=2024843 RepID=UPI00242BBE6E|nr:hypothetical protein [Nitrosopumilus sp.]MCV0366326.1 hypothetical protein [Nitrosopumilus sp.]
MVYRFTIYHDIPKSHEIKIHRIDCSSYVNRDPGAVNSDWRTAYDFQTALTITKKLSEEDAVNYRMYKKCKPS